MVQKPNLDQWKALAAKQLKGQSPDTLDWHTPEGIRVKPLYTGEDLEKWNIWAACRALRRMCAGPWPRCMPDAPGPYASMPVSPLPANPMHFIAQPGRRPKGPVGGL
jgi:hypothetical protein